MSYKESNAAIQSYIDYRRRAPGSAGFDVKSFLSTHKDYSAYSVSDLQTLQHNNELADPQWWKDNNLDPNAPSNFSSGDGWSPANFVQRIIGVLTIPYVGVAGAVAGAQPGTQKVLNQGGTIGKNLGGTLHGSNTLISQGKISNSDRNNAYQFSAKVGVAVLGGEAVDYISGAGDAGEVVADYGYEAGGEAGGAVEVTEASDYEMAANYMSQDGADISSETIGSDGIAWADNTPVGVGSAGSLGSNVGAGVGQASASQPGWLTAVESGFAAAIPSTLKSLLSPSGGAGAAAGGQAGKGNINVTVPGGKSSGAPGSILPQNLSQALSGNTAALLALGVIGFMLVKKYA